MLDEWCERQVDRLCEAVPAYFRPRMTRLGANALGWHLNLLVCSPLRRFANVLRNAKWVENEPTAPPEGTPLPDTPGFEDLPPQMQEEIRQWYASLPDWSSLAAEEEARRQPLGKRFAAWVGRFPGWLRRVDDRLTAFAQRREARAQRRMVRNLPRLMPVARSRFAASLLMMLLSVLGLLATGSGDMGYLAASCCVLWLSVALDTDYEPVCGYLRQRYLASMLARAGSFLLLLPAFFGAYVRGGVPSNIVLQSTMIVMLVAHAVLFLALVAPRRHQPLVLRAMAGVCGVVPALTVAAAVALAVASLARPVMTAAGGICCAAGALLAFCADRLLMLCELGGIRLRYGPVWIGAFTALGAFLMVLGAWLLAMPAV